MKTLLSIKPEFAEKIFSGEKGFEFRKADTSSRDVSSIVLYVTAPVGKIVGEFKVVSILEDTPASLWEQTRNQAGISKQFFFTYFKGRKKAFAIGIGNPRKYEEAIDPIGMVKSSYLRSLFAICRKIRPSLHPGEPKIPNPFTMSDMSPVVRFLFLNYK